MSGGSFVSAGLFAPVGSSMSVGSSASAGPSTLAGFWAPTNVPMPADLPTPVGLVLSPHACLPVVQDRTKPFFIGKPVIALDNTTARMYTKSTIWISGVPFSSLDKAWEYIVGIPNDEQQCKIAKDIAH